MICAREENVAPDHFSHNAAYGPQIHVFFVAHTKNYLRKWFNI